MSERSGTTVRLVLGAELLAGLRKYPELTSAAETLGTAQAALTEIHDARRRLELALVESRADLSIEEHELLLVMRGVSHRATMLDRQPRGPLGQAVLPQSVDAMMSVARAEQVRVCRAVLGRMEAVRVPGIESLRREEAPRLRERLAAFEAALARFTAAEEAIAEARRKEVGQRDVHLRELERARGETVAAFPRERGRQRAILPKGTRKPKRSAVTEETSPAPTSPSVEVEKPAA